MVARGGRLQGARRFPRGVEWAHPESDAGVAARHATRVGRRLATSSIPGACRRPVEEVRGSSAPRACSACRGASGRPALPSRATTWDAAVARAGGSLLLVGRRLLSRGRAVGDWDQLSRRGWRRRLRGAQGALLETMYLALSAGLSRHQTPTPRPALCAQMAVERRTANPKHLGDLRGRVLA